MALKLQRANVSSELLHAAFIQGPTRLFTIVELPNLLIDVSEQYKVRL